MNTPPDPQPPRLEQPPLFETPADPDWPARPAEPPILSGRPRLRTANREQIVFRAAALDELIPPDHPAGSSGIMSRAWISAPCTTPSRPSRAIRGVPPSIPRSSWRFGSTPPSRGSAAPVNSTNCAERHDAYRWILGDVTINYHTLSDFRTDHVELLDQLLTQSVAVLMAEGLVDLNRVAQDGMRVRASAGAASFRRRPTLEEALAEAEAQVEALRAELEDDPAAGNRRQQKARERAARERAERIKGALERLPELEAKKKPEDREKARCSTTDPDATVMKMADGGFRPAYNVQFSTATDSQIIVGVDVVTTGSDAGQMAPMVEQIEARYDQTPEEVLVDGGFAQHDQIEAVSAPEVGCTVYAPVPEPKDPEGGSVRPQARRQSGGGGLAEPDGQRGGQGDLQGASRDGRMRQRAGAESGVVPVAGARPTQGQGDRVVVRFGS